MTVFVNRDAEKKIVTLIVRTEEPNGTIGDTFVRLLEGDDAFGKTYEEWMRSNEESVEIR